MDNSYWLLVKSEKARAMRQKARGKCKVMSDVARHARDRSIAK